MSPSSQSSCVTTSQNMSSAVVENYVAMDTKKRGSEKFEQKQIVHRKSIDTSGQRTSQYRGVTRYLCCLKFLCFFISLFIYLLFII